MGLLKTINISPCIQLLCRHCAPLSPAREKEWCKMHLGQRKRGINSQHRNDDSFLLSMWFVGSLSKPPSFLHTHLINVRGKGLWEKADVAAGTREPWTQNRNTSREGRSSLNLPSTTYLQLWWRVEEEEWVTKRSKGAVDYRDDIQDYRDEKGNTLSPLKVPNPLSISDLYSIVTETCYHKLDEGIDSRLFSCPYVSRKCKALYTTNKRRVSCCLFSFNGSPGSIQNS